MPRGTSRIYVSLPDDCQNNPTSTSDATGETARLVTGASGSTTGVNDVGDGSDAIAAYSSVPSVEPCNETSTLESGEAAGASGDAMGGVKSKGNSEDPSDEDGGAGMPKSAARGSEEVYLTEDLPTAEGVFVGTPLDQPSAIATRALPLRAHPGSTSILHPSSQGLNHATSGSLTGCQVQQPTVVVLRTNGPPPWDTWGRAPREFVCRACSFAGYTLVSQVRMLPVQHEQQGCRKACLISPELLERFPWRLEIRPQEMRSGCTVQ